MSLATLKKKSRNNRRIAPISGRGVDGFSLNGGYRNVGAVGQFRMISNNTRTPFRGTEPMGNGGTLKENIMIRLRIPEVVVLMIMKLLKNLLLILLV